MSGIYYYMTLFPTEALIASMLTPSQFGAYMSTGYKSGSHEHLIFTQVEGGFGSDFDWDYAAKNTVEHPDGQPKHSLYLSIYRVLERVPPEAAGNLFLTTSDGRTLEIEKGKFPETFEKKPYYLYQNLCPVNPLVISLLPPGEFGGYMVRKDLKISLPAVFYCDLKVVDISDPVKTGNIGPMYDRNIGHLNECIRAVTERGKITKMLERTFAGRFTFQIIQNGFAMVSPTGRAWYPMPKSSDLATHNYDWAYSAMII